MTTSIVPLQPRTIYLGGPRTQVGDIAASESITPGHLIERWNNGGIHRWRKHTTGGGDTARAFATEQSSVNQDVTVVYAANDLVEATIGAPGTNIWAFIASGQNITFGQKLESAGDGTLRALASGTALATALEDSGAVVALTRIRVEVK